MALRARRHIYILISLSVMMSLVQVFFFFLLSLKKSIDVLISSPQDLHQFRIMGAAIKRRRVRHSGCLQIDIYLCCLEVVGFFFFRFLTLGFYETRALINSGQHEEETNSYIFKKIKK